MQIKERKSLSEEAKRKEAGSLIDLFRELNDTLLDMSDVLGFVWLLVHDTDMSDKEKLEKIRDAVRDVFEKYGSD